ncbi:uncharacterized protein LOC115452014 [Manduca sexta]|uniref:uncharacterized protein LOC115452014 n=1 Tax=Manduca sexta TaxID=7130 RepID=UPI00189086A5|nr:uncharacterized protein LOC115452014 [Manduca sexta]
MDLKSLKIKIKNLRSIYHTELKKLRDSKRSPDGSVYKSSLSWFDEMHSFLGDLAENPDTSSETELQVPSADNSELLIQDTRLFTNETTFHSKSPSSTSISHTVTPASDQHPSKPKQRKLARKKRHESNDNSIPNAIQELENISRIVNTQTLHTEDEFHYFALSVAAQLRSLPLHIAVDTQSKIQSMLSAVRLSYIFSNNSSPSSRNHNSSDQPSCSAQDGDAQDVSGEFERNEIPTPHFEQAVIATIKQESETD